MGWGGARVGSGKKPKGTYAQVRRKPDIVPLTSVSGGKMDEDALSLSLPPEDLPLEHRDFWHRYAKIAIEKGTLNHTTVAGFRLLCEQEAELRAVKAQIEREGRTYLKLVIDGSGQEHHEIKKHPLKSDYNQLAKDVRTGLLSFRLTAFGKAEPSAPKKPAVETNPWAKVAGQS